MQSAYVLIKGWQHEVSAYSVSAHIYKCHLQWSTGPEGKINYPLMPQHAATTVVEGHLSMPWPATLMKYNDMTE